MKFLQQIQKAISEKVEKAKAIALDAMATQQLDNIHFRLDRGIGLNDQRMPLLMPEYAKRKGKGRIRTLRDTGQLRNSIVVDKKGKDLARIRIYRSDIARKAKYTHEKYPWWGISREDRKKNYIAALKALAGVK